MRMLSDFFCGSRAVSTYVVGIALAFCARETCASMEKDLMLEWQRTQDHFGRLVGEFMGDIVLRPRKICLQEQTGRECCTRIFMPNVGNDHNDRVGAMLHSLYARILCTVDVPTSAAPQEDVAPSKRQELMRALVRNYFDMVTYVCRALYALEGAFVKNIFQQNVHFFQIHSVIFSQRFCRALHRVERLFSLGILEHAEIAASFQHVRKVLISGSVVKGRDLYASLSHERLFLPAVGRWELLNHCQSASIQKLYTQVYHSVKKRFFQDEGADLFAVKHVMQEVWSLNVEWPMHEIYAGILRCVVRGFTDAILCQMFSDVREKAFSCLECTMSNLWCLKVRRAIEALQEQDMVYSALKNGKILLPDALALDGQKLVSVHGVFIKKSDLEYKMMGDNGVCKALGQALGKLRKKVVLPENASFEEFLKVVDVWAEDKKQRNRGIRDLFQRVRILLTRKFPCASKRWRFVQHIPLEIKAFDVKNIVRTLYCYAAQHGCDMFNVCNA